MNSIYTKIITDEAEERGITVTVLDPEMPIFELSDGKTKIRCWNALTDLVGAPSFYLANNKRAAISFLREHGFSVPEQISYTTIEAARQFLKKHEKIVVKPALEWGGRGITAGLTSGDDLEQAISFAEEFSSDEDPVLLESFVEGIDTRFIFIDYKFVAAFERHPAKITGTGNNSIRELIEEKNLISTKRDKSNFIPMDKETERTINQAGWSFDSIPEKGIEIQVRQTANLHTGGSMVDISNNAPEELIRTGKEIAKLLKIPVLGIDFLVNSVTGAAHIVETSPDLAIASPNPGVVKVWFDYLFPETKAVTSCRV